VRGKIFDGILGWIIISRRSHLANEFGFSDVPHGSESRFRITISQRIDKLWIRLVDLEFATGKTDTFEDLFDLVEET
jgi:hypothetical protein